MEWAYAWHLSGLLGKTLLKQKILPSTVSLPRDVLDRVFENLFPRSDSKTERTHLCTANTGDGVLPDNTVDELRVSVSRTTKRTVTSGLDGIPGKVLAAASNFLQEDTVGLFQECFRQGRFPDIWKNAELILITKPGKEDITSPSAYRLHMSDRRGKKIFRKNHRRQDMETPWRYWVGLIGKSVLVQKRSFCDWRYCKGDYPGPGRSLTQGGVTMAVSLDILNIDQKFTLRWSDIGSLDTWGKL